MAFEDTFLVSQKLMLVADAEITTLADWLRRVLDSPLPKGYREYLTTLGEGTYCDEVWVYPPKRVLSQMEEARGRWSDHFFWSEGKDVLTKESVVSSLPVGSTANGDEIIFSPEHPQQLFVLPRHDDAIYTMPQGFLDPIGWFLGGRLTFPTPPFRYFEPSKDRAVLEMVNGTQDLDAARLADRLIEHWNAEEVRQIRHRDVVLVFARVIGGRVQLTQGRVGENRRIRIRIDYDRELESIVNAAVGELEGDGFRQIFRVENLRGPSE